MPKMDDYLVGIDIGCAKVGVLIGHPAEDGTVEVVGRGKSRNRGSRKGNIVNVDATVAALKEATEEAEVMAGVEISRGYVGVAGTDVRSVNSRGMVSVSRKDGEISEGDVRRVLDGAKSAALPSDREVLHAIPQQFMIDDQHGIADPLGMQGKRLEVAVHLVTANVTRLKTLVNCVNKAGIEVIGPVFEPLATAEAILTHDERELGVLLLDIGSGTTEYAVFADGEIEHSAVLAVGATHFTNDLAMVLRTPWNEAEDIKRKYGCCLPGMVNQGEGVSVPTVAGGPPRVVPKPQLCDILQPRANELLSLVREDLIKFGYEESLRGGVVLTGGGSQLDGLLEMSEEIFDCGVRYGLPRGLGGLVDVINSPAWCTASGLLLHALSERQASANRSKGNVFNIRGVVGRVRGMFSDLL